MGNHARHRPAAAPTMWGPGVVSTTGGMAGAPLGNQNALRHARYARQGWTDEEIEEALASDISTDECIDDNIRWAQMRMARALQMARKVEAGDPAMQGMVRIRVTKTTHTDGEPHEDNSEIYEGTAANIMAIENAVTAMQNLQVRLLALRMKHALVTKDEDTTPRVLVLEVNRGPEADAIAEKYRVGPK